MSRSFLKALAPAAALIGALTVVSPASATDTTFATYSASANGAFKVTTTSTTVSFTEAKPVVFSFLNTNLASVITGVKASLTFTATGSKSSYVSASGFGIQSGLSGTFKFTSLSAYTIGNTTFAAGDNLLTVTFSNGTLAGQIGGKIATLSDDTTLGGTITYTSDFLNFSNGVTRDFSDTLTAIAPKFGGTKSLNPFTGTPTGSFAQDPVPLSNATVPEPATWLMMLVGFGAIGLGVRGTRRNLRTA